MTHLGQKELDSLYTIKYRCNFVQLPSACPQQRITAESKPRAHIPNDPKLVINERNLTENSRN